MNEMPLADTYDRGKRRIAHATPVKWAIHLLTTLSVLALLILLVMTSAGVIMRYVFNAPILGNNEIIQLVCMALVTLALPLAAYEEGHIRIDVLDQRIGAVGRFIGDILARGIALYILSVLAIRTVVKLKEAAEFGDATNMLQILLWPFYGLLILGAVLYAVVLLLQLIDILRKGASHDQ